MMGGYSTATKLTSEMRLHALQRMDELSTALEVHGSLLRQQGALNLTPRPEQVLHPAPRILGIGAKVASTVLARSKARRGLCESDVDDTALVHAALDVVRLAVLGDLHGALLGAELVLVIREGEVVEVIRSPELGGIGLRINDLCVELRGGADAEDVAEDDLHEAELAVVGGHVEGLGLDVGRVHDLPAEVVLGELGVGHIFGLLDDGLDGLGAVLALGDADTVEEGVLVKCAARYGGEARVCSVLEGSVSRWGATQIHDGHRETEVLWLRWGVCGERETYAFFAQLNMIADVVKVRLLCIGGLCYHLQTRNPAACIVYPF